MLFFLLSTINYANADEYKSNLSWEYETVQVTLCSDAKVTQTQVAEAIKFWKEEEHPGHKKVSSKINIAKPNDASCKRGWKYGHILIAGERDIDTTTENGRCKYWHHPDTDELVSAFIRIDDGLSYKKRGNTLIHEFGHAVGLQHEYKDPGNVMFHTK